MSGDRSDNDSLVARIAAGDSLAEIEFVSRYRHGVTVLVRRHCRPSDPVVEDIVQDIFTRVLEKLRDGALESAAALPGYLQASIVRATAAEYRNRRPAALIEDIAELPAEDSPVEFAASHQLRDLLHRLIDSLSVERDREILRLFYLNDEHRDDVCRQLGIEFEHFHRVVFRARERFRVLLAQSGIEEF